MKKTLQSLVLLLVALMMPTTASAAWVQVADGVYQDGSTLCIGSGVTSLGSLQLNPSVIYCYATIPPACMSNTFTGYGATLHVSTSSMVSYFTAQYWYNFNNILADVVEPQSVTMSDAEASLELGKQLSLSATVAPSDATPSTIYWSSTNTAVATVGSNGTVTAVGTGECYIRATCVDKQAFCHLTVTPERVTITLDKHEARLLPNHTLTLNATCLPAAVDLAVTSSDPAVALPRLVNGTIMVVGIAEGTATITVNAADGWGIPDQCVVTVYTELGDVNCDGFINIADVVDLIDYLLTGDGSQLNLTNADTDKNDIINIADVTELIDYLLNGYWSWDEPQPQSETFTVNGVTFTMVAVEGGTFTMGATAEQGSDAFDSEKPAHDVTLSSYCIGQTEVTQALWQAVMGSNPSYFTGNLQRPVETVSWNDCQTFISKLNQLTGKTFRLPTEAEWEFAATGGKLSQGYKYSGSNTIDDVAWYWDNIPSQTSGNAGYGTQTVATKAPNELGLYDMSGNVREWCQDWYGSYSSESQTNPTGPSTGSYLVVRGGSWSSYARYCRVSGRGGRGPTNSYYDLGLRLALSPDNNSTPEVHEWVDLGLPSGTLWATCNVGADTPEGYGDYFACGETEPKDVYNWSTYKWCNGSYNTLTKYCTNSSYGTVDNKTVLEVTDDAAYVNWGENWRMPTLDQQIELINKCTWTWTTQNGVNGRLVTGPNGNSLFLPAAGYRIDSSLDYAGSWGRYWSRTLSSSGPSSVYGMFFDSADVRWGYYNRYFGFSVRPVRVPQN